MLQTCKHVANLSKKSLKRFFTKVCNMSPMCSMGFKSGGVSESNARFESHQCFSGNSFGPSVHDEGLRYLTGKNYDCVQWGLNLVVSESNARLRSYRRFFFWELFYVIWTRWGFELSYWKINYDCVQCVLNVGVFESNARLGNYRSIFFWK